MLEYEDALARILAAIPAAPTEIVALSAAHRRIAGERLLAPIHLPPFDNSAMDGYALRAGDVRGASGEAPVSLRLTGRISAGESFAGAVEAGTCARIFTGAALPAGADAVVMQEDARLDESNSGVIQILDAVKPWENIRFRSEDVREGAAVVAAGDVLTAGRVGLLAALGITELPVGKCPVVGLLATGSELVEGGNMLESVEREQGIGRESLVAGVRSEERVRSGRIYESNRATLAALLTAAGAIPKIHPVVKDDPADTRAALKTAFAECEVVITSGGVSVGEMDFVKEAFTDLGGKLDFWRVAIRPGKPFVFGQLTDKILFGLPGNPVSAFVTFLLFVHPAIRRWQGAKETSVPIQTGILTEPLVNRGDRRHFMRVSIDTSGNVRSAGGQASHLLSSLAVANGLVDVPANGTLATGTPVRVMKWE